MLEQLRTKFPTLKFAPASGYIWSPKQRTVYYFNDELETPRGTMAILHEVGHALLGHEDYQLDIELLNMEVAAWTKARELARLFGTDVNEDHVEDCLDTYRLWLFKRSRCPRCNNTSVQTDSRHYGCFVCGSKWQVAATHSLQPRRMHCIDA